MISQNRHRIIGHHHKTATGDQNKEVIQQGAAAASPH
jgi:hypothetical protein